MPEIAFDRYYRYEELTSLLRAFAEEFPHLVELSSIGKSHEGRDIWLLAVTDRLTGPAEDKPAFWCDGNIHATEVSASTAVLHLLHKLCTQHGHAPKITEVLTSRAFYLVPRLSPDGAELALADRPKWVRSSARPYPYDDEDLYGIERQDVDGDGRVLSMRFPDPNGAWVISEEEPRLLRKRKPGENDKPTYRVITEGLLHHFDGLTLADRKPHQALDFNRNFPSAWRQENEQRGAGPYPTSEPEIRACVQAIVDRPNICGAITFHTFSGVHLRPPSRMPDDEIPAEDLWIYKQFGEVGHEMTGYPAISNFHEFKYHPKEVITGTFDDWIYEHIGVFAWTTEIWSPQRQAGITDYKYIDWFRDHPFEHDKMMLKWSDEKLDGRGYIDWYAFEHPQLGPVELGGWDAQYAFRNPPPNYLESEVASLGDWAIWQAAASPKMGLRGLYVTRLDENAYQIRLAIHNEGFLPTTVTELAKKKNLVRGIQAEIHGPAHDASSTPDWLLQGKLRQDLGQLSGWSGVPSSGFGLHTQATSDVAIAEWVVRPGHYTLEVKHPRAGRIIVEADC